MIRCIRNYSTGDKPLFLSDLLQRVQKINLNVKPKVQAVKPKKVNVKTNQKPVIRPTTDESKKQRFSVTDVSIIDIAEHPLANSGVRSRFQTPRTSKPRNPRVNRKQTSRPRQLKSATSNDTIELSTKTIKPISYKPSLTNSFMYGKSTNFQINLTSRITSVIKSQILKSKYPYKLPRSIIDNAPEDSGNRFLLSSNYTKEINEQDLINEINEKVKGSLNNIPESLESDKKINQNPTLSLSSKQVMTNIIQTKNLSQIFNDAHWRS
ncbi:hypothetical protein CLIB1444_03S05446 [[Candida] jaroonii]|uniref:Uncharacterized protein n=1 Tax=[Candida] jaroonii TaxID=467808 RepID=A0ACA9Y549_9ASCO|nr:hypothetical protein CLIB1444_03S05446 [[Candida] jaroonii]